MAKSCPRCGHDLAAHRFGAEQVDGCHACGGLWLHCEELNRLIRDQSLALDEVVKAFRRALPDDECRGAMACPACGSSLAPFRFPAMPDMPAHVCAACRSVWLDDGDMQQIAVCVAAVRSRSRPTPGHEEPPESVSAQSGPEAAEAEPPEEPRPTVSYLVSGACPACDAANPPASTRCWSCGSPLRPVGEAKRCPSCHTRLLDLAEGDLLLSICDGCCGAWMEDGRLAVFLQLEQHEFAELTRAVAMLRDQAKERRAHEEAEALAGHLPPLSGVPRAASDQSAPAPHGSGRPHAAPPEVGHSAGHRASDEPPDRHGSGHGILGFLRGRGHAAGGVHHSAVVSPGAHVLQPAHPSAEDDGPMEPSVRRCPACRYEMHPHEFGSTMVVVASICAHCRAVWLDEAGFHGIYELVRREGMLCARGGASDVWGRD